MKKIRIGHLGTYHDHSLGKLECILKYPDLFEVVGVVAESEETLKKIYKPFRFRWLLLYLYSRSAPTDRRQPYIFISPCK